MIDARPLFGTFRYRTWHGRVAGVSIGRVRLSLIVGWWFTVGVSIGARKGSAQSGLPSARLFQLGVGPFGFVVEVEKTADHDWGWDTPEADDADDPGSDDGDAYGEDGHP